MESKIQLTLPKQPKPNPLSFEKVKICSNHFSLQMQSLSTMIYQYAIKIEPEIAFDARGLSDSIIRGATLQLNEKFGKFLRSGWILLAPKDVPTFSVLSKVNGKSYDVSIIYKTKFAID